MNYDKSSSQKSAHVRRCAIFVHRPVHGLAQRGCGTGMGRQHQCSCRCTSSRSRTRRCAHRVAAASQARAMKLSTPKRMASNTGMRENRPVPMLRFIRVNRGLRPQSASAVLLGSPRGAGAMGRPGLVAAERLLRAGAQRLRSAWNRVAGVCSRTEAALTASQPPSRLASASLGSQRITRGFLR